MFTDFSSAVHRQYEKMSLEELYVVDVHDLFETYLAAFPEGTNPIFRQRTEHDCNCCKNFVRRLGKVVTLSASGGIGTVWDDWGSLPHPYDVVAKRMQMIVRQAPVVSLFRSRERQYGQLSNYDNETSRRWDHFCGRVADRHYSTTPEAARGPSHTKRGVLTRGLTQITLEHVDLVLELIDQGQIYRGEEHRRAVAGFRELLVAYEAAADKDAFTWINATHGLADFRNTVVGGLLVNLAEGDSLEAAVGKFESQVAPRNYKRSTSLVSQRMVDAAVAKLEELGLSGAVHRRHARVDDVSVNDVLWVDNDVRPLMRGGLAGLLAKDVRAAKGPDLSKATEISVEDFVSKVLPTATGLDVMVRNSQLGNFVSVTGGDGPERLFRWDNNFAWSYDGDVTDSVRERVKRAGGRVEGAVLRVSLGWHNYDDLDIHCQPPSGRTIYFGDKQNVLDVDMNVGERGSREAVENLSWMLMPEDGVYKILVHNYTPREDVDVGFTLEVETAGGLQQYSYPKKVRGKVPALEITVSKGVVVRVAAQAGVVGGTTPVQKWGVTTETLTPVRTVFLSPNHWGEEASGNRHWFFVLSGCLNPDPVRGVYNEHLRADLSEHRKVLEVLGARTKAPYSDEQLSGVGFSSTKAAQLTAVVRSGGSSRAYNVTFGGAPARDAVVTRRQKETTDERI